MENFEIKRAKLQDVLNKFKKISDDLEKIGSDVKAEYTELLANYWTGESANQFSTNPDEYEPPTTPSIPIALLSISLTPGIT